MPVYEYRCINPKCEKVFEKVQRITAGTINECPVCGSIAKREISLSTFKLKGSGFYVNDYGSGNGTPPKTKKSTSSEATPNATQPNATTPSSLKH